METTPECSSNTPVSSEATKKGRFRVKHGPPTPRPPLDERAATLATPPQRIIARFSFPLTNQSAPFQQQQVLNHAQRSPSPAQFYDGRFKNPTNQEVVIDSESVDDQSNYSFVSSTGRQYHVSQPIRIPYYHKQQHFAGPATVSASRDFRIRSPVIGGRFYAHATNQSAVVLSKGAESEPTNHQRLPASSSFPALQQHDYCAVHRNMGSRQRFIPPVIHVSDNPMVGGHMQVPSTSAISWETHVEASDTFQNIAKEEVVRTAHDFRIDPPRPTGAQFAQRNFFVGPQPVVCGSAPLVRQKPSYRPATMGPPLSNRAPSLALPRQPSRVPSTGQLSQKSLAMMHQFSERFLTNSPLLVGQRGSQDHTSRIPTVQHNQHATISEASDVLPNPVLDELDEDDENLSHAATYSVYKPAKLRSGLPHPDPVVETSSLSSVNPPDIFYHVRIPEHTIDTGKLSALQLEAIIYACQQHENFNANGERTGYLIGDGAGVGKGRIIAGLIHENYLLGRKRAIWFSVSTDLKYDAERDLTDIGADRIKVFALNKFKYCKISGKENGSAKKGVVFSTYPSLIGESSSAKAKYMTRLKQLVHWCGGKDFEGLIVFDECHRAKNLMPVGAGKSTKTALTVLELQKALPRARVVYASATGATETRNMAYMTRLGLWGPGTQFKDFQEFLNAMEKRGVGAMEIVAMDMKQRGLYLARQLSFVGTSFRIDEVPLPKDFVHMYDESVKLWLEAKKQFQIASRSMFIDKSEVKSMWSQFWSAHQRFFKYLCIASKVSACVKLARDAVKCGKCVVIGLQSTGEARTLEQLEDSGGELTDFVSTAKNVFLSLVERHFPVTDRSDPHRNKQKFHDLRVSLGLGNSEEDEKKTRGKRKNRDHAPSMSDTKRRRFGLNDDDQSAATLAGLSDGNDDDGRSSATPSSTAGSSSSSGNDSDDESSSSKSSTVADLDEDDGFNPFADDLEDAWEAKLKKRKAKKIKKRSRRDSNDEENDFDELGKQLERELEESLAPAMISGQNSVEISKFGGKTSKVEKVDAEEFLHGASTFFETNCADNFGASFGMNHAKMVRAELLAAIERLSTFLPTNTLDQLIDELGGPDYVAEMTGRKGRVVTGDDGNVKYELRNEQDVPLELMNLAEKERFMNGSKHIAIISEAASSGISLQSDRRAKNQRRRVHITLELPWSADKAVQQFGRTHRSNQVNAPEYIFLISELAGEYRFASVVAKRLESLGALTHGDRRATESRDLSQFNLDTKYGRVALDVVLKSILGHLQSPVPPPAGYESNFFLDMRRYTEGVGLTCREKTEQGDNWYVEKDVNMSKFLNRILGLPVYAQNSLFQYFADTLRAVVGEAKKDGRYDMGILDLGSAEHESVKKVETRIFVGKLDAGGYRTELHQLLVDRGMTWEEALKVQQEHDDQNDGFYISTNINCPKPLVVLVCAVGRRKVGTNERLYNVFRPNTGLNPNVVALSVLLQRYGKVSPEKVMPIWKQHHEMSLNECQHFYCFGRCKNVKSGLHCEIGKRQRSYYILSGSVLSVWNTVENVLCGFSDGKRQEIMQIMRIRTDQDQKIVGILIPNVHVRTVTQRLTENASRTYLET